MKFFRTITEFFDKNVSRATEYLLLLIIILIPFSVRYVFSSTWNFHTGAYSDFTSISLYISDLVLIALVVCFIWNKERVKNTWTYLLTFAMTWIGIELLIQNKEYFPIQLYFSLRVGFLIIFALIVSRATISREKIAWLFTILGGLQSLIAMFQFYWQKSLGLYYLGESHLSPETLGVAKIVAHGTKIIRGYGTFPHSNLLSAFLLTATLLNLYLIIKNYQIPHGIWKKIILYLLLGLNIFGVFLSFSRGGLLALGLSLILLSFYLIIKKNYLALRKVILLAGITVAISILILLPYLSTRTTISDNAVKERVFYNELGLKIIKDKPLFGTGLGTNVLHMKQYSNTDLQPWEIQPIHNYFLISWSEWGIGAIVLLLSVFYPIYILFKRGIRNLTEWQAVISITALSFLGLFLLDHYFYTIWPTQLLLWLIVGLLAREAFISYRKPLV